MSSIALHSAVEHSAVQYRTVHNHGRMPLPSGGLPGSGSLGPRQSWAVDTVLSFVLVSICGTVWFGGLQASAAHRLAPPRLTIVRDGSLHKQTLGYRAPEVLFGDVGFGPPMDVWSLGIVLCNLTGDFGLSHPPGAASPVDYMAAIFDRLGVPTSSALTGLPLYPSPMPRIFCNSRFALESPQRRHFGAVRFRCHGSSLARPGETGPCCVTTSSLSGP